MLAAYVAIVCHADALINLSDVDGLYDKDPRRNPDAKLIPYVERVTEELLSVAGGAGTDRGTGGMATKLLAAQMVTEKNIAMVIANGADPAILYRVLDNKPLGTLFAAYKA